MCNGIKFIHFGTKFSHVYTAFIDGILYFNLDYKYDKNDTFIYSS